MLGRGSIVNVSAFSTGIASIDVALGCGGLPQGRIMEIYGPESGGKTTTCLQFIAACQKHRFESKDREGVAAFIDAEHALDPVWAGKIGVDMDQLLLSQPSSGEEAFSIIEMMVKSGLIDLIVVDSVAALVPQVELDGELTDANIGAHARMMSKAMRKIKGIVNKSQTTVIFINQIREKIGVMFGCLHADTLVCFTDGRSIPIRDVVEQKIEGNVWSYNIKTKSFESKQIIDWHHNGEVSCQDDFLHFTLKGPGTKNGCMQITVTPGHKILLNDAFVEAEMLSIGDKLTTKQQCFVIDNGKLNGSFGQFLSGVLAGGSNLSKNPRKYGASLRIRDNIDIEYMHWKALMLNKFLPMVKYSCRSGSYYNSSEQSEFTNLKKIYPNRDPMLLLHNFSWLGFAIWIMDDAVFERGRYQLSIKRFRGNFEKLDEISDILDELGLYHHMSKGGRITFDTNVSKHIAQNIQVFVPPFMDRKLPTTCRGQFHDFELTRDFEFSTADVDIIDIRPASGRQMKQKMKYDISIDGNHNYMAGGNPVGVIVHNSPEVTPGGRALKFYASIRGDVRRGATLKDGDTTVGFRTSMKMVKNKVAPPFMKAEFDICVGQPQRPVFGIDEVASLIDAAGEGKDKADKIIHKSGNWFIYGDVRLGNGLAKASAFLRENPKVMEEIRDKTYNKAFNSASENQAIEGKKGDPDHDPILDGELLDDDND